MSKFDQDLQDFKFKTSLKNAIRKQMRFENHSIENNEMDWIAEMLIDIASDKEATANVRLDAMKTITDRFIGKQPTVEKRVEVNKVNVTANLEGKSLEELENDYDKLIRLEIQSDEE
mgnify:CR=1 FL=1